MKMSRKQQSVLIEAPGFGTGTELCGEFTGYCCGYCHGNGWLYDNNIVNEHVTYPCPRCEGTGKVKGIVKIEWVADYDKPLCENNPNE